MENNHFLKKTSTDVFFTIIEWKIRGYRIGKFYLAIKPNPCREVVHLY